MLISKFYLFSDENKVIKYGYFGEYILMMSLKLFRLSKNNNNLMT